MISFLSLPGELAQTVPGQNAKGARKSDHQRARLRIPNADRRQAGRAASPMTAVRRTMMTGN